MQPPTSAQPEPVPEQFTSAPSNGAGAPTPTPISLSAQRSRSLAQRLRNRLEQALREPLGPDRLQMVQQVAGAARHAELDDIELSARLEEVWDAFQSGQTTRALSVFSWILDQFWQHEEDFSLAERASLWQQFLWVAPLAARNPAVGHLTVTQLLQYLDDFSPTLTQPSSDDATLRHRWTIHYQVALGLGQRSQASQALSVAAAVSVSGQLPATEASCPLHVTRPAIAWAVTNSDFSQALALADQAWQECEKTGYLCRQPQDLDPVLMLPLAWAGQGKAAWQSHQQGFLHQLQTSQFLGDLASHLRYCLATWNLRWGVELLSQHAHWFSSPEDPWDLLTTTRAAAALLRRTYQVAKTLGWAQPQLGFGVPGANVYEPFESLQAGDTMAHAAQVLEKTALNLAARFDLRNENNTISLRTRELLAEPSLCPLAEVRQLLHWRHRRCELLVKHGIPPFDASWVVGKIMPQATVTKPPAMRPSPHWQAQWQPWEEILDALTGLPSAPGTFPELDLLCVLSDKVALATRLGHFEMAVQLAPTVIENARALPWSRLALRTACYLVQAQWASGDLSGARQTLMLADSLADETVGAPAHNLLEQLTALAG